MIDGNDRIFIRSSNEKFSENVDKSEVVSIGILDQDLTYVVRLNCYKFSI